MNKKQFIKWLQKDTTIPDDIELFSVDFDKSHPDIEVITYSPN